MPIYVIDTRYSGVAAYATQAEADAVVAESNTAQIVPAAQIDPEVRRWHEERLAAT